ncbi:MAG: AAA family ATPase, partial [bacterium]
MKGNAVECPSCQHENPEGQKFCGECGKALVLVCPKCDARNPPSQKFCGECGHDLSRPIETPESHPSPSQPDVQEGERRQATVLFSDLSGYTAMNERLDPEEVTGIVARFKAEAERIVAAHGGTVNQFVGDEVFALFGIPTAHEDDPQRAVRAALELHEAVRALGDEVEARLGETLRLHSGINTGLVVTSAVDGDERGGRYAVTGDTINTAARLVSRAETDQIIVGAATRRQVAPFFDLEELEPVALKGKARPLVTYRVLGVSGVASRFEAAEARGFTPYTGRESDLAALAEALERTSAGEGQFVTVSGEAGLGKSRLLYEFRQSIDRGAVSVLQGRCQSFGTATPYLPLTNALRRGLELRDEDTPAEMQAKAVANLRNIDPALEKFIPVYLHLLSIPSSEHPLPGNLSGEALRRASQDALAAVFLANLSSRPMVLILEDWHWADEASDTALRHLVTMLGGRGLMVVINYRPEYQAGWEVAVNHQHLTLSPLTADHTAIIANSVLEAHRLPEGLGELIHQRTGGNPFFIEEMCLDLLEEGVVLVKDGRAALTRPAEKLELPGTVQGVIRSRLDRLGEDQQEVLRLASVIGREFELRLLSISLENQGGQTAGLEARLQPLIAQGLIQQVRVLPEVQYMFKHVLTQVVIYETLLLERRKALHGMVGRAMEELYAERLEERVELLAHHFRLSGDTARAVSYLEQAGRKAGRMSMYPEAGGHFAAAVNLLQEGGQTRETKTRILGIILRWANAGRGLTNDDLYKALIDAIRVADDLGGDVLLLLRLNCHAGFFGVVTGYRRDGRVYLQRARKLIEEVGDREECIVACSLIGQAYKQDAQQSEARMFLDKAIRLAETAEKPFSSRAPPIFASMAHSYRSEIYSLTGEFEK